MTGSALDDDLPAWEMQFHFLSGRLSLNFCATVGERWRRNFERLPDSDALGRWVVQAGLAPTPPVMHPRHLVVARELREAIYRAVRASMDGRSTDDDDRATINACARRAPLAIQIDGAGRRYHEEVEPAGPAVLSTIARDAVELLTGDLIGRVRECAAEDCALLFLDSSRPGRRRWCSDKGCGSRSRSSAYRARRAGQTEPRDVVGIEV